MATRMRTGNEANLPASAPSGELLYAKDTNKVFVGLGGSILQLLSSVATLAWDSITGKPSTFPPTLPIAESDVTNLSTDLTTLQSNITSEASTRASAITTEATARASGDSTEATARASAVTTEATSRASADTTLQTNIDAEATARASAITTEATARASAITTEATARAAADTTLQTNINAKQDSLGFTAENVTNKDTSGTLASNSDTKYASQKATKTYVDAEATARAAADTTIQATIDAANKGDTYILTSHVSASGNPDFFTGSGAVLTVDGSVTPLVYFVKGLRQTLSSAITITPATPGSDTQFFVLIKKNTSGPGASDLVVTNKAPVWAYVAPSSVGASSTNNIIWFNMADGQTYVATSSGGAFSVTTDMILLGTALISSAPATRAALAEPYRMTHTERIRLFGDGSDGQLLVTGTTTIQGVKRYQALIVDGGTLQSNTGNFAGMFVYSQTPVILSNTASVISRIGNGGAGTASANGGAGGAGAWAGNGGGGGGAATTRTGGAGGSQLVPQTTQVTNAGGTAGAIASAGGNAVALDWTVYDVALLPQIFFNGAGGGGGGGAGDGNGTGGNGGGGGKPLFILAPSIFLESGSTVSAAGSDGAAGGGTSSGGGGGGGGSHAVLAGGFVINSGTLTAAGGGAGTKAGTGGNGGTGGAGKAATIRMW